MIDALIQGKLLKDPEARQTKAGKPYATARVRVPTTNPAETIFVSVAAFDPEAVAALLALNAGDSVSVAGSLKVGVWMDGQGNAKPQADIVADRVLSVYAIRKQRAAAAGGGAQPLQCKSSTEKPSHAAWQARQVAPTTARAFAGADDLDF